MLKETQLVKTANEADASQLSERKAEQKKVEQVSKVCNYPSLCNDLAGELLAEIYAQQKLKNERFQKMQDLEEEKDASKQATTDPVSALNKRETPISGTTTPAVFTNNIQLQPKDNKESAARSDNLANISEPNVSVLGY